MATETKRSNTTDKLVIDIKVNVRKGTTTKINSLTKSLTKLNEVVKHTANIEKYANALKTIGKELTRTTSNKGVAQAKIGNQNLTETVEVETQKIKEQKAEIGNLKNAYEEVDKAKAKLKTSTQTLKDGTQKEVKTYTEIVKGLKRTTTEIDGVTVAQKTQEVQTKKSTSMFAKFTRSIGRIALYRMVRSGISKVADVLKNGINNIKEFDEETNNAFKSISLSVTTLSNSVGSLFVGLIQNFAPVLTKITDAIGNIANKFNEAQAVMKGSTTYMKVLTSDTKEWQEQVEKATGSLLEFDKFLSLNKDDKGYTGLIESETSMSVEDANNIAKKWKTILDTVVGVSVAIAGLSLVKFIADLGKVGTLLKTIKGIGTFALLATSITLVVTGIKSLVDNWKNLNTTGKILIPTVSTLLGLLTGAIVLVLAGTKQWAKAIAISGIVAGGMATVLSSAKGLQKMADGGMVEKGTSFIAGEAGAEVVHTSARGTGVTNIEQFSQAMLQALATYGVARGSDVSLKGDVYINQTKAGQLLESSVYGEGVRVGHFKRV